jgi:hypothetical protein
MDFLEEKQDPENLNRILILSNCEKMLMRNIIIMNYNYYLGQGVRAGIFAF